MRTKFSLDSTPYTYLFQRMKCEHFLKKDGAIVVNEHRIDPITVVTGAASYPENIIENLEKEYQVYKVNTYTS